MEKTMEEIRRGYAFKIEFRKVDPNSLMITEQHFEYVNLEDIWEKLYELRFDWRKDDEDYRVYLHELDDTTQCKVVSTVQLK